MCIAILNPGKAKDLSRRQIRNSFHNNPDGFGMAWAYNGALYTYHSVFNGYRDGLRVYRAIRKKLNEDGSKVSVLVHMRLATHGKINEANCHPFLIRDGQTAVVHNGIISGTRNFSDDEDEKDKKSDTWLFCEYVLDKLPERWYQHQGLLELVSDYLSGNKLILLESDGCWVIINPRQGDWEKDGNWYSNGSHKWRTRGYGYGYGNGTSAKTYGKVYKLGTGSGWAEDWDPYSDARTAQQHYDTEWAEDLVNGKGVLAEDDDEGSEETANVVDGAWTVENTIVCDDCMVILDYEEWDADEVVDEVGMTIRCDICQRLLNDPHSDELLRASHQQLTVLD
jgi:hypothetical protein